MKTNNKVEYRMLQLLDYAMTQKPKGYSVSLTVETNGDYKINFIKENNE